MLADTRRLTLLHLLRHSRICVNGHRDNTRQQLVCFAGGMLALRDYLLSSDTSTWSYDSFKKLKRCGAVIVRILPAPPKTAFTNIP